MLPKDGSDIQDLGEWGGPGEVVGCQIRTYRFPHPSFHVADLAGDVGLRIVQPHVSAGVAAAAGGRGWVRRFGLLDAGLV